MVKSVKLHQFTVDDRFPVIKDSASSFLRGDTLTNGLVLPDFQCPYIDNKLERQKEETVLLEREFIWRLQFGAGELRPPSNSYTLRLLSYHYDGCKSQRGKKRLITDIRRLLRTALEQVRQRIDSPTPLDYEGDPDLSLLTEPYDRLVYADQWIAMRAEELKLARFQSKAPSIKVVVLAYRLLLEAGELPPHLKALDLALAQFIAEQQREKKQKGTVGTIHNYLRERKAKGDCFINTKANYDAAREWIEEYWPKADMTKVRSLPNMQ